MSKLFLNFIFLILFSAMGLPNAHSSPSTQCHLETSLPQQQSWTLSNNVDVLVPTFSGNFQTIIVFGRMDIDPVSKLLREQGLYPLELKGPRKSFAIGALSFFNYKNSDMGPFREIYFVVVATKKKLKALGSLKAVLRAMRSAKVEGETDLVLFHLKAYSSSETGVLSSEEIWKIDSEFASIGTAQAGNWMSFTLKTPEETTVGQFDLSSFIRFPKTSSYNLDASGPGPQGKPSFSHVLSCSEASYAIFNPKAHRISLGKSLRMQMERLGFGPWFVEYSPLSQAIQFPPRSFIDEWPSSVSPSGKSL